MLAGGNRRDLDRQHPAPREPQRRDLRAHRSPGARDVSRPGAGGGGRGRARRPHPGGAAGAACARARSTRRSAQASRSTQLLPHGSAQRVARARPSSGGRGCRGAPASRRARPAQCAGGRRACPRAGHAGAAFAAHPAAGVALGGTTRCAVGRIGGAPPQSRAVPGRAGAACGSAAARDRARRALPRGGGRRPRRDGATRRRRARLDVRVRRHAGRVVAARFSEVRSSQPSFASCRVSIFV